MLALTTNQLDAWSYYSIASARLLASDPLFYLLGLWYGDSAITWMEKRTQTWGQMLRQLEGWFSKAAYPIVFLAPNNYICMFAGASGMRPSLFIGLNVAGILAALQISPDAALPILLIVVGAGLLVSVPLPSWARSFWPQQDVDPEVVTPQT